MEQASDQFRTSNHFGNCLCNLLIIHSIEKTSKVEAGTFPLRAEQDPPRLTLFVCREKQKSSLYLRQKKGTGLSSRAFRIRRQPGAGRRWRIIREPDRCLCKSCRPSFGGSHRTGWNRTHAGRSGQRRSESPSKHK